MMRNNRKKNTNNTDNDAAIARLIAQQDQELEDENLAYRMQTDNNNRSSGSGGGIGNAIQDIMNGFPGQRRNVMRGNNNYNRSTTSSSTTNNRSSSTTYNESYHNNDDGLGGMSPFSAAMAAQAPPHMCYAPCVIGVGEGKNKNSVCVEMMIDTGAQASVMSLSLARQLGLEGRINRSRQGIAAGVGRARIVGHIMGVICELGQVEFVMNFAVLDVGPDKLLLCGLDLMRKYKCIVDLDKQRLIFGGEGGVAVPLLPPSENQNAAIRNVLGAPNGCSMM